MRLYVKNINHLISHQSKNYEVKSAICFFIRLYPVRKGTNLLFCKGQYCRHYPKRFSQYEAAIGHYN